MTLSPCPYHKPGQDCGHTDRCPLFIFGEYYADCTTLTPIQIHHVRTWVERRQCAHPSCKNPAVWRISIENGKEQTVWSCEEHFEELRQTAGIFLGAIKA